MINEEWKAKAKEAWEKQEMDKWEDDVIDHLEGLPKKYTEEEIDNAIEELKNEMGMQLPEKAKDEDPFAELNQKISSVFVYRTKSGSVTYDDLRTPLELDDIAMKRNVDLNRAKGEISDLLKVKHTDDGEQINENLQNLLDFIEKKEKQKGTKIHRVKVNLGWMEQIGNLPLGRWETRDRIYSHWEGIHKKHTNLVEAFDVFNKDIDKLLKEGKGDLSESLDDVRNFYKKNNDIVIPNYVLKLNNFNMKMESAFPAAITLIGKFLELKNISEDENITTAEVETAGKEDEAVGEDVDADSPVSVHEEDRPKFIETASMNPAVQEVVDETKNIKLTSTRNKTIPVDPIFWYKYNDNYEDMSIPMADLKKIKDILTGEGKRKSKPLLQLMPVFKESQQITDEFMNWFGKWEKNMKLGRSKGPFYLPISPFIEDEYIKEQTERKETLEIEREKDGKIRIETITRKVGESQIFFTEFNNGKKGQTQIKEFNEEFLDETNELTEEFLKVIVNLGKKTKDAYDVYNKRVTTQGEKDKGGVSSIFK